MLFEGGPVVIRRSNSARLWSSLMEMAQVGATPRGGVCRLALSDADGKGRDLFCRWCRNAGLQVRIDGIGNIFARRERYQYNDAPVMAGSHLDTQPTGGRFDGAYGVLAALEVVRTLNDLGITTHKPIEIVCWTNEEGARFTPAMLGSAVFTGKITLDQALALTDSNGISVRAALDATGYLGTGAVGGGPVDAYFEAHIEQGPVLEENGIPIGVVTGGQGIRWFDVKLSGHGAHAGTTPMEFRRDALFAAAEMIQTLEQIAGEFAPRGLVTVGQIVIPNASRNTIPAQVSFTVDFRHPADKSIDAMEQAMRLELERVARRRRVETDISIYWNSPVTPFDNDCVVAVAQSAAALGYAHQEIVSGAGHDAINMAHYFPTAMVFIPCANGLSHNEAEEALPEHVAQGADVLLNAVLARAGVVTTAESC
jgi:N-carbamoyl-L-amino-acid hydrolase